MIRSSTGVCWNITDESPIVRREYERPWTIPPATRRVCVYADESAPFQANAFPQIIGLIAETGATMLMECDELFRISRRLHESTEMKRPVLKMDLPAAHRDASLLAESARALLLMDGLHLAFTMSNDAPTFQLSSRALADILQFVTVNDWIGTVWPSQDEIQLMIAAYRRQSRWPRFEAFYLENLPKTTLTFFLGPSHNHMEIMSARPEQLDPLIPRIRELLV